MPVRVAKLVRVSTTHLEQADSPQHQLAFLDGEAAREGWVDTGLIYRAELTGAVILDRPDIRRMLQDAAAGQFDAILLKSISRLGRDTLGLLMVKRMLDDVKVELVAVADGYRSFRDPELIFLVHAERAQAGRQEIAKNVRAGIVQAARRGIWPAGTLPFGLRKQSRFEVAVDAETAPIVQRIFALRRQGWGLVRICAYLNGAMRVHSPEWWHLRTRIALLADAARRDERVLVRVERLRERLVTGTFRWQPRTVRLLLENPAYRGELRYNRTGGERRLHGRLVRTARDQADWVVLACPALVDPAEWAEAQAVGAGRRRLPRRAGDSPFLLSGLIFCGQCGAPMRGAAARPGAGARGGETKGYYACRGQACLHVRASLLEGAVLSELRSVLGGFTPVVRPSPRRRGGSDLAGALADLAEARFFRREELRRGRMSEADFAFEMALLDRREAQLRAQAVAAAAEPAAAEADAAAFLRLEGRPDQIKALLGVLVARIVVISPDETEVFVTFLKQREGSDTKR